MFLNHVALSCNTEQSADRFYLDLLGLEKTGSKVVEAALIKDIFGLDREFQLIKYSNGRLTFEIFITQGAIYGKDPIGHVCLDVEDREAFLARCRAAGAKVSRIPAGSGEVIFIQDFDGNRFEIKELAVH